MVMTRQPPVNRRTLKNHMSEEDDYWNSPSSSRAAPMRGWDSARRRTSPPRVAAAAAAKPEEGLSLYEELLRYHRENPDEEDKLKIEEKKQAGVEDDDRKPAARPTEEGDQPETPTKPSKGTYRVPVSREYFAAKDREGFSSPTSPARMPVRSPQQLAAPNLSDDSKYAHNNYPSNFPDETPLPLAELRFHDSAEDEALARQLQAEEEERVAAFRRNMASTSSMPPLSPMTPSLRTTTSASDEALARRLAQLATTSTTSAADPVYPAVLATSSAPMYSTARTSNTTPASVSPTHIPARLPTPQVPRRQVSGGASGAEEVSKQENILRDIMQENERKQIEWAMEQSKRVAEQAACPRVQLVLPEDHSPGMSDLPWQGPPSPASRRNQVSPVRRSQGSPVRQRQQPEPVPDWEASQRAALEEFQRQHRSRQQQQHHPVPHQHQHHATGHMQTPSLPERYHHHEPEQGRASHSTSSRESMLQRGRQETNNAIRAGQARIVRCQGCAGRLQAPVHYSRVYCPKCGHVSPVDF